MKDEGPFKVGDLVRLKNGWTAMKVAAVSNGYVAACYGPESYDQFLSGHAPPGQERHHTEFVPWGTKGPKIINMKIMNRFKENERMSRKLYTWQNAEGTTCYGTRLAVNSRGEWVMDPKGGGQPIAIEAERVAPVVPYSVKARDYRTGSVAHYRVSPQAGLQIGHMVLQANGQLLTILETDTRSEKTSGPLRGIRIEGTPIGAESSDEIDEEEL